MLRGPHAADFALLGTADGAVLGSGEARVLGVVFTPGAEGERTASLEFEANVQAGRHSVTLTGIGTTS